MLRAGKVTRLLQQNKPGGFKGVFKINVVGSTGSGKTAFMKCILGDLFQAQSEATRRTGAENKFDNTHTWFRIGKKETEETPSTTTLSMNTAGILLVRTLFNSIEFHSAKEKDIEDILMRDDIEEIYKLNFFDNAGQERFDFMPDITMRGSDAVIIIVDGTNMSSISKIQYYLELIQQEEHRKDQSVPIIILLNKSDLIEHGCYIGLENIKNMINVQADFYQTSVVTREGIDDSIISLVSRLHEKSLKKV